MFCSKYHIESVRDIPQTWIFEHYLNIEPLQGQNVKIFSIFNPKDRNPSMHIYYNITKKAYRFKCFSTGNEGSALALMTHMWNVDERTAATKIANDYAAFLRKGGKVTNTGLAPVRWKVSNYSTRPWNKLDVQFWSPYNIGSKLLKEFNVVALSTYTMTKIQEGEQSSFTVSGNNIYGYFNKEGDLYKIYQPYNPERKFIKVRDQIQGHDQLTRQPYLVICSSLKDAMALKSLGLTLDVIAPDSENVEIPKIFLDDYLEKYEVVMTLFDNDATGIRNMIKYRDQYDIPFVLLKGEKDIADNIRKHGARRIRNHIIPIIHRQISRIRDSRDTEIQNHENDTHPVHCSLF